MPAPRGRRSYTNPITRSIDFWTKLKGLGFDPAIEWNKAYLELDDPKDRLSAVANLLQYCLPKPKPMEDVQADDDTVKIDTSYELLKKLIETEARKECQQSGLQLPQEPSQLSSPSELVTELSKQG